MNEYIVSIGGSNIDIQGFSKENILLKESNPAKINICAGGVERNIVHNLSNLGLHNIKFITSIGNDIFGDILLNNIKSLNIDTSYIIKKGSSTTYMAIMNSDKDMYLAVSDMDDLDKNITIEYLESIKNIIKNAKLITIDAVIKREIFEYLIKNFPDKKLLCDAVSVKKAENIKGLEKHIYALKLNSNEASFLLDKDISTIEDGLEAVSRFIDIGVSEIYITFAEKGICYASKKTKPAHLNAPKVNILNASGAGDAFMAGIIYSIYNNFDLDYKVKFAAIMSMLALESEETINNNISLENVQQRLKLIFNC